MTQIDNRAMLLPKPVTPCTKVLGSLLLLASDSSRCFAVHLFGAAAQAAEKTAHGTSYGVTQNIASVL